MALVALVISLLCRERIVMAAEGGRLDSFGVGSFVGRNHVEWCGVGRPRGWLGQLLMLAEGYGRHLPLSWQSNAHTVDL